MCLSFLVAAEDMSSLSNWIGIAVDTVVVTFALFQCKMITRKETNIIARGALCDKFTQFIHDKETLVGDDILKDILWLIVVMIIRSPLPPRDEISHLEAGKDLNDKGGGKGKSAGKGKRAGKAKVDKGTTGGK